METGLFAIATLFMGLIGTAQLAAHQVSLQLASIAFMVPLGLSQAATIRIGLAAGAGDMARARLSGWVACGLGTAFMAAMAILFWTARAPLAGLFLDPATPEGAAAMGYAVVFLRIAALFQLVDGLQVIGIASLRGLERHGGADVAGRLRLLGRRLPDQLAARLPHAAGRCRHLDRPRLRAGDGGRDHGGALRPADPAAHGAAQLLEARTLEAGCQRRRVGAGQANSSGVTAIVVFRC